MSLIFRQGSDNWSSTGSRQSSRWDQRFLEGVVDVDDDDVTAGDDDVAAGDIYIMIKCLFVTKNHHFLL